MGGVTKQTYVTSDELLPKVEAGQTSIILGRNLVKKKKSKPETKKKSKRIKSTKVGASSYPVVTSAGELTGRPRR